MKGPSGLIQRRAEDPEVTFAYGTLNFHHSIDERIPVDAVVKTAKVYAAALMDYLGVAEEAV